MGVQYQPIPISFTAGLDTKSNDQASKPPTMDILQNVEFNQVNGYQKRKPFNGMTNAIQGGGTLANMRGIFEHRGELCVFSNDTLYTWSPQLAVWAPRGTHLAIKVDEVTRFGGPDEQTDCDRAELTGVVMYTWVDNGFVYIAAVDKANGATLLPTTGVTSATRPRLVALQTKILLFCSTGAGGQLSVFSFDPTAPTAALGGAVAILIGSTTINYDVVQQIGADVALVATQDSIVVGYQISRVTAALAVTSLTKARACDGPIAVSCTPDGLNVQIIRSTTTNLKGDLLLISSLADVIINQALGTSVNSISQITACHQSVKIGGHWQCHAFWTSNLVSDGTYITATNWVDDAGTIGVQATLVYELGLASRAFDFNGRVFVWLAFGSTGTFIGGIVTSLGRALQNAYFLYRDDGFLCAKAAYNAGGGFASSTGRLPGVALTGANTYAWCGNVRGLVQLATSRTGYSARSPQDITFAFDSSAARRSARLGATRYIAAGEVLAYDGAGLVELGFHIFPWYLSAIETGAGAIANGIYFWKPTFSWVNASGERDRSTTATVGQLTLATGPDAVSFPDTLASHVTHKAGASVELWRTQAAPGPEASFYLVTSLDPNAGVNPNRYLRNDPTLAAVPTFNDALADASIAANPANPENGAVLEVLAPPAASIIMATADRVFLAGIAGSPDSIWYSKQRTDGLVAGFSDFLQIAVPVGGGAITGMHFLNETLIVFRERATFAFVGQGLDNAGGGQNYAGTRISPDIGAVNAEGIARTDTGLLFKSSKGWYTVGQNLQLVYVGGSVAKFDADVPLSCVVMDGQHQVRCLSANRMLVWDTLVNNWAEWTISDGIASCMWNGVHVYLTATGPKIQAADFTGVNYGMVAELAFLTPADLQGSSHVRWYMVLGEYRGDHKLQLDTCRDYLQDGAGNWVYLADAINVYTPATTVVGSAEQVRHGPSVVKYQAIKVRITELLGAGGVWTEGCRLTGITFEAGSDGKLWPYLPASQKA